MLRLVMASKHNTDMIKKRLLELQSFSIDEVVNRQELERKNRIANKSNISSAQKQKPKAPQQINDIMRPSGTDHLFWCFYMMNYGEQEYFFNSQSWFGEMSKRKIELVTELRKNKALLKPYKLKLADMEGEMVSPQITSKALIGLSVLKSLPVIFIKNRTYIRLGGDSSKKWNIVTRDRAGWYLRQNIDQSEIDKLTSTLYEVKDMEKPIKSVSSYTLADLREIAEKLGIDIEGRKLKKSDLYQEILSKL